MKKTILSSFILCLLASNLVMGQKCIVNTDLPGTVWRIIKNHNQIDTTGRIMYFYKNYNFEGQTAEGHLYNYGKYSIVDNAFITVHAGSDLANRYQYILINDTLKYKGYYLSSRSGTTEGKIVYELIDEVWVRAKDLMSEDMLSGDCGIKFDADSDLATALAHSAKEGKFVFIDCFTSWCGPCKYLASNVFTQTMVGNFYNKNFINLSINMESPTGKAIAEKYKIRAYPTLLFLNSKGEVEHMTVGASGAKQIVQLGKTALDTTSNMKMLRTKIVREKYDAKMLNSYLSQFQYAPDKNALLDEYFKNKTSKERFSAESWNLFYTYMDDVVSPQFHFFMKHREEYTKKFGIDSVNSKLEGLCYDSVKLALLKKTYPIKQVNKKSKH